MNNSLFLIVLIVVLLIFLDLHDDNLNQYEESQDPQPWVRIRLRRVRLPRVRLPRVRLPRVRISFQKLKCPAKCVAYSLCMVKTKGIGYLICRHIKKNCPCWKEYSSIYLKFFSWAFVLIWCKREYYELKKREYFTNFLRTTKIWRFAILTCGEFLNKSS